MLSSGSRLERDKTRGTYRFPFLSVQKRHNILPRLYKMRRQYQRYWKKIDAAHSVTPCHETHIPKKVPKVSDPEKFHRLKLFIDIHTVCICEMSLLNRKRC